MRKLFVILGFAALALSSSMAIAADVYVNGYTKSDGTYVAPHYRTAPDNTTSNNYSTYPNVNPYTGQQGTHRDTNPYGSSYGTTQSSSDPYGSSYGNSNNGN